MNIKDCKYLVEVDRLKSFSKAALTCFISQPALSQQIKKVEDQIGFDIFERDKKNIITTKKGAEVIIYAKSILELHEKIKQIKNKNNSLNIGLIPTICPYLLPKIVDNLHKKLPKIKFYFSELKTKDLIAKIKLGEIDAGIIAYFSNLIDDKLNYQKLYDEEFLLTLPKKSKLTTNDFVKIIKSKNLILLEEGNCMSDNIKEICSIYSQNSFSDFYATNIETVKNMLRINNGAALLPKLSCLEKEGLKTLSFKPKKFREVGIIHRTSYNEKLIIDDVSDTIKSTLESHFRD